MREQSKYRSSLITHKRSRKVKIFAFFIIFILLIIFITKFTISLPPFTLQEIQIEGLERLSRDEVLKWINLPTHISIFKLNLKEIAKRIESKSSVKKVSIRRILPSTIYILVKERTPYAYLLKQGGIWEVDEEGVILNKVKERGNLPLIKGPLCLDKSKLGKALKAIKLTKRVGLNPIEVGIEKGEEGIVIYLKEKVKIYLGRADHLEYLYYVPDVLLDAQKRKEKIEKIDLRFKGQLVVTPER